MKKYWLSLGVAALVLIVIFFVRKGSDSIPLGKNSEEQSYYDGIQSGDIIFQTSKSSQSMAIQFATKSKYSHCGIIYKLNNKYYVFEAIQSVTLTPLKDWIERGVNKSYVIKRLIDSERVLTAEAVNKMMQVGKQFDGKTYDLTFEWSDDRMYCSELIWKIYQRALGIEVGNLERLKDFDLTNEAVKLKMKERYGNSIPLNEIVISPVAIFDSNALITVVER